MTVTPGSGDSDFVPFATGIGANVQDAEDWTGNLVRQLGFQAGVANPTEANTVWRQASAIASMIAQFSSDYSEEASVDDGDIIAAEERFIKALIRLFSPFGVYYIQDTGTGNHIVGTSDPSPSSYAPPCFVIFKKSNSDNDGPMDINLWTLGAVSLRDNTGADLSPGAIKANSFYVTASDGGGFRILGGAATYTSVSNLTANSGDGVEVTIEGIVNRRTLLGSSDTNINTNDRWARGRAADDHDVYVTSAQFLAWIMSNLPTGVVAVQWFTATGTYTKTTGAKRALVIATGGGGAGAVKACGGGGGAGATAIELVDVSALSTVPVAIGAGGAGAYASGMWQDAAGGNGGTTSFGAHAVAGGGYGSQSGGSGSDKGGVGGTASAGTARIDGGDGASSSAVASENPSGSGGASFWGSGGAAASLEENHPSGYAARAIGSGGGGGTSSFGSSFKGGNGKSGAILVIEFA
jgi:hypothetical protein